MPNKATVYKNQYKLFVYMTFGEWLRNKLKETGLSNAEVARRTGLSSTYIGNLVRDFSPNTKNGKGRPSEEAVALITSAVNGNVNEARAAAGYSPLPGTVKPVQNAQEFLNALQLYGLPIPNFMDGIDLEKVSVKELNTVLESFLYQLSLIAKSKVEDEALNVSNSLH